MLHYKNIYSHHFIFSELLEKDHAPRLEICTWLVENSFVEKIFTTESCLTRNDVTSFHNLNLRIGENFNQTRPNLFQRQFSINVWGEIFVFFLIFSTHTGEWWFLFKFYLKYTSKPSRRRSFSNASSNDLYAWWRTHILYVFTGRWIGRGREGFSQVATLISRYDTNGL